MNTVLQLGEVAEALNLNDEAVAWNRDLVSR